MQTLNVVIPAAATCTGATNQVVPAKVLDCDTITQVKEKLLEQTWKGTSFSQRPHIGSLQLGQFNLFTTVTHERDGFYLSGNKNVVFMLVP